jgi:hypothetical protein
MILLNQPVRTITVLTNDVLELTIVILLHIQVTGTQLTCLKTLSEKFTRGERLSIHPSMSPGTKGFGHGL